MDMGARYVKSQFVVARRIADEYVLVPIRKNTGDLETIYTLNDVGAEIWEMLDGDNSLTAVCDGLVEKFDVSKEEAEKDLENFVRDLSEMNCISIK